MTPKLPKYFTIPWLDRILVIMDTFRTPSIRDDGQNEMGHLSLLAELPCLASRSDQMIQYL
jgi:hypothetical protein